MQVAVSTSPGWMMGSPICPETGFGARSVRARTWLLLRMYCVPPRTISAPKVPPQQVIVWVDALVVESLAFPPEVPSTMAPDCACWFTGTIVTIAVPDAEFTCEIAVTVAVVVTDPPLLSDRVGTPLGAT